MKKPILLDFPHQFETERLVVRCPLPGDGPEVHEAIVETFENLKFWFPWANEESTAQDTEENVRKAHCRFLTREDLRFHLFLKGTQTLVGCSSLHRIDWEIPRFEIGYWCRKRFEGQGFISEAVTGLVHFAVEELGAKRIEIRCDARNERSRKVAERAGFNLDGVFRQDERDFRGELCDTLVFSRIYPE